MKSKANQFPHSPGPAAGQPGAATAYPTDYSNGKNSGLTRLLAAGGIVAATGAASCCVIPFILFILGVSGAWIGNLTALEPYKPIFVAMATGCIGYGFYLAYGKPRTACTTGSDCAKSGASRVTQTGLWVAGILFVIALGFPKFASLFL